MFEYDELYVVLAVLPTASFEAGEDGNGNRSALTQSKVKVTSISSLFHYSLKGSRCERLHIHTADLSSLCRAASICLGFHTAGSNLSVQKKKVHSHRVKDNVFFCVFLQLLQNVCFPTQNFQALPRQPLQITKKQYVQGELHTNQPPCLPAVGHSF